MNDYEDENKDPVRTYVEHHLREIDEADFEDDTITPEKQLINKLQLVRVGFYGVTRQRRATVALRQGK